MSRNQTVYKEVLSFREDKRVRIPVNARLVKTGMDGDNRPAIWFLCDPAEMLRNERQFAITGTGGIAPSFWEYVDTFFDQRGSTLYVWHVWEIPPTG